MVASRAAGNPLYDQRKVEELILERTKIPNAKELLTPEPKAQEMNAVNENVAASLGRPIAAFPEQDHLAHIQVHLDYLQSPFFGYLAVIAPNYVPAILSHLREHIALWYVNEAFNMVEEALEASESGMTFDQIMKERDPEVKQELDRLLAQASPGLIKAGGDQFGKIPDIIAKALEVQQQYSQPPMDPALQVAQVQERIEDKKIAAKKEEVTIREQSTTLREGKRMDAQMLEKQKKIITDKEIAEFKERHADARNMTDNEVRERMNRQDNLTAMTIAAAEIENNENTQLTTGTGINPQG
jgi:hypothetical protein